MNVPLYIHIPVVLSLLIAHGLTVRWALRRIRDLQAALVAKKVLLGPNDDLMTIIAAGLARSKVQHQPMAAGETLTVQGPNSDWYVEIKTRATTTLEVKSVQLV